MFQFPSIGKLITGDIKGRIEIFALICLFVTVFYFTQKYHEYKEENLELTQKVSVLELNIKSANAERDFAYFQLDKNKEMQDQLEKERDRIKDKYDSILHKNNNLEDANVSQKLVGILNDVQDEQNE